MTNALKTMTVGQLIVIRDAHIAHALSLQDQARKAKGKNRTLLENELWRQDRMAAECQIEIARRI